MTSVDSNFNFLCGCPHGGWTPPPPVHMRPPEPDPSLPLPVDVINGWPPRGIQHPLKNELVRAARHSNNLSNHMKLTIKPLATSLGRAHANGCNLLISTVLPYCSTGR